jgi:hypothetical protein
MIRPLFLIHRYLGICVGTLMVGWCLSGVVMMYHGYPQLDESDRVRHLTPIDWSGCCKISDEVLADDDSAAAMILETLAGKPVLQLAGGRESRTIAADTGLIVDRVSPGQAAEVARAYSQRSSRGESRLAGLIDYDQWTVAGRSDMQHPLYRFELGDALGTEVYVSSVTGQAVQITTSSERFWNWLGAVPHWLYFAKLRRNASLWSVIIIATSLAGCFLAVTGITIGVLQWVRRPAGRWTPYRGFNLWHHVAGLVFGLLALSWALSGLLSVNPWGWLEGAGGQQERALLQGTPVTSGRQIREALRAFAAARPPDVVSLSAAPLNGGMYFIATTARGQRLRFSAEAVPAPLNEPELARAAAVLGRADKAPVLRRMMQEDAYYFSHHRDLARLPVYRLVLADGTRYYLDDVSGALIAKFDGGARAYRWLHEGLHRMDFTPAMRGRPQWDALMLALMSGVTLLCVTGTYLGYRRLLGSGPKRPHASDFERGGS